METQIIKPQQNIVRFQFDLMSIKNFVYFITNDYNFEEVYFILINNKVYFISSCRENFYLTISNENTKVNMLNVNIQNDVNNGNLNFKHVFAINKDELKQFLKLATKNNDEFYFNLTDEDNTIRGNCSIWKNGVEVSKANLQFQGQVRQVTSDNQKLKTILNLLLYRKFDFKEIDFTQESLNVELKYYSAIDKCINSYKHHTIHIALSIDKMSKLTNVSIYADDGINEYFTQIIIAHIIENDFGMYKHNSNVLSDLRKQLSM